MHFELTGEFVHGLEFIDEQLRRLYGKGETTTRIYLLFLFKKASFLSRLGFLKDSKDYFTKTIEFGKYRLRELHLKYTITFLHINMINIATSSE